MSCKRRIFTRRFSGARINVDGHLVVSESLRDYIIGDAHPKRNLRSRFVHNNVPGRSLGVRKVYKAAWGLLPIESNDVFQ